MMRGMKTTLVARTLTVAFAFAALTISMPARAGNELDGKSFTGTAGEKGKTESKPDEFVFAGGKFHSTACDALGFKPADYTAEVEGDVTTFGSITTSDKEGEIHWVGHVAGDSVEGSFIWKKPGQDAIEYWFKGSLKKAG
jgi:hypothetical protein